MDSQLETIQRKLDCIEAMLLTNPSSSQGTIEAYLPSSKAAEFLSVTPNSLRLMVHKKQINHIKKNGKLFFRRSDLIEWFESGSVAVDQVEAESILLINKKRL
jgi:hypothetical protein